MDQTVLAVLAVVIVDIHPGRTLKEPPVRIHPGRTLREPPVRIHPGRILKEPPVRIHPGRILMEPPVHIHPGQMLRVVPRAGTNPMTNVRNSPPQLQIHANPSVHQPTTRMPQAQCAKKSAVNHPENAPVKCARMDSLQ
jgi:hypothetical protein